jgi:hypothetical protein
MKLPKYLLAAVLAFSTVLSAAAQTWTEEQREVWGVIDAQWKALKAKEPKWDQFLHPKFMGWESDAPAPDDSRLTAEWSRFHEKDTTVIVQKLTPLAIVVHGNTAVAHYLLRGPRPHQGRAEGRQRALHRHPRERERQVGVHRLARGCRPGEEQVK